MRYSHDPPDNSFFHEQPAEKSPQPQEEISEKTSAQKFPKKSRSDSDRRIRQGERLARLLQILHLLSGPGRWDAASLAAEFNCSRRTMHRLLQTLSLSGIPWYYDESLRTYKLRPDYKSPLLKQSPQEDHPLPEECHAAAEQLLKDGETFATSLAEFLATIKQAMASNEFS